MGLLETILRPRTVRQIRRLSLQIAERSLEAVRQRLNPHAQWMSAAEARGYVRARAGAVVAREVAQTLTIEGRLPEWGRVELLQQATSHVVSQLGRELGAQTSSQARPARRAA